MRNILVIGGTGFIGSNLVKRLVKDKNNVYVVIRPNSKNGTKKLEAIKNQINFINVDVSKLKYKNDLPQFDICYNLAAYGVDYSNQDIKMMIEVNIKMLIDIIDFVKLNKSKLLVHTGSCFEYGLTKSKYKMSEEELLNPQGLYGASKLSAMIIGNRYAMLKKINMITLRPFGVYGLGEDSYRLVPQLVEAALNNTPLNMTEGEQVRDYLYIDDMVEAFIKIAYSDKIRNFEVYNICSSLPIKIKDFVDIVCRITKCNRDIFKLGALPYRRNEVMYFVGDNTKLKNVIEWDKKISLEEGLKLYIDSKRKEKYHE